MQGTIDAAFVPIENSATGSFHGIIDDMLMRSSKASEDLYIVAEYQSREPLHLVALPGAGLNDITEIRSQNHLLAQCEGFLSGLDTPNGKMRICQDWDSAASAKAVKEQGHKHAAAIASARAAELHGLTILQKDVGDDNGALTRFIVVSKTPCPPPERHTVPRTSLALTTKNQPGAFFKVLSVFALRDIKWVFPLKCAEQFTSHSTCSISKVESRPSSRTIALAKPWEYVLYVDIEGSTADQAVVKALQNLEDYTQSVKLLGSYPRFAPPLSEGFSVPLTFGIGM